jgi:hypothetical protein
MEANHRRSLAELTSNELHGRAMEYRRMALVARGRPTRSALNALAIRFALLAARLEVDEARCASRIQCEVHSDSPELKKLAKLADNAAACEPNTVRWLADRIRTVVAGDADPYLIIGVLVEGAVHTLAAHIPVERQQDTAGALLQLMGDRLAHAGLLGRP